MELIEKLFDVVVLAGGMWFAVWITTKRTPAEQAQHTQQTADNAAIKMALECNAQVVKNQAQLLGEYSKILNTLRDHRDEIMHVVAESVATATAQGVSARMNRNGDRDGGIESNNAGSNGHPHNVA